MTGIRRPLATTTCLVVAAMLLGACNPVEDQETVESRRASPCSDGRTISLGKPNPFDRWATFKVKKGPVWIGVDGWDPRPFNNSPYRAVIDVGPANRPPKPDANGNIASRTDGVIVEEGKWSPLDVEPGGYWLLASDIAGTVLLQTCDGARVESVPANGSIR